jgi:branched-subunit amino acid ABC-type transport system permease component
VSVLVVGPVLGLLLERMARAIEGTSLALRVASTVGLLLVIEGALELLYDPDAVRNVPVFLARGQVEILDTTVQWAEIITFAFALVATAALSIFFRKSRRGVAMRAVVDNPDLLDIAGTSPAATRRLAWVIGVTRGARRRDPARGGRRPFRRPGLQIPALVKVDAILVRPRQRRRARTANSRR